MTHGDYVDNIKRLESVVQLPERQPDAHKGNCGRVLIVAGSMGMAGAAVLSGRACLRGGSDGAAWSDLAGDLGRHLSQVCTARTARIHRSASEP